MAKQRPRFLNSFCVGLLVATVAVETAGAQQSDALLKKLVEKGLLTTQEAQQLREESDRDFTRALSSKSGMPDWVTSLTWRGDYRLRFDQHQGSGNDPERTRYRYRLRYGVEAELKGNFRVGFRFGSGESGNPISYYQSMGDNGDKKALFLDLAYAAWTPLNNSLLSLNLVGGKMDNPFNTKELKFSDSIFDSDYTPEGVATTLNWHLSAGHDLALGAALFLMDENSASADDPYLTVFKTQLNSKWTKQVSSILGMGTYTLHNRSAFDGTGGLAKNNSGGQTSPFATGFTPFMGDASLTYALEKFPLYTGAFPITLAGEYIRNPQAPEASDTGYSAGITFGKSGKKGLWDLAYRYKSVQANAVWEDINDSDYGSYSGGAFNTGNDTRGHIVQFQYNFTDSMHISAKYFLTERISTANGLDSHRLLVDLLWKF